MRSFVVLALLGLISAKSLGQQLYVSGWPTNLPGGDSAIYRVQNPMGGPSANVIGQTGIAATDIAISPQGNGFLLSDEGEFGSENDALRTWDLDTGATSFIGSVGIPNANGLGFDLSGNLFMIGYLDANLYQVDPSTGTSTVVATAPKAISGDLAASPDGLYLFITAEDLTLVRYTLATHEFHTLGPTGVSTVLGLAFVGDELVGTDALDNGAADPRLFRLGTNTGMATEIGLIDGAHGLGANGLASRPVPEPATLAILSLGLFAFRGRRNRCQRNRP